MIPLYQTDHAVSVAFTATVVIWIVLEVRQMTRTRQDAAVRDNGSRYLMLGTIAGGIYLGTWIVRRTPSAAIGAPDALVLVIAFSLMWVGFAFRLWSILTLGRYFTYTVMTSPDQQVVVSGPYRLLRHPSYAGLLAALAGMGLAQGNWLSVAVIIAVPLVGMVNRIRVEESALTTTLGERYTSYASGRKRLIPFVW